MVNEIKRLLVKINFYFEKQLQCHLKLKPTGFVDGKITSQVEEDTYLWFLPEGSDTQLRVFLVDIYDVKDFEVRISEKEGAEAE